MQKGEYFMELCIGFILGALVGLIAGTILTCLIQIGRGEEEKQEKNRIV